MDWLKQLLLKYGLSTIGQKWWFKLNTPINRVGEAMVPISGYESRSLSTAWGPFTWLVFQRGRRSAGIGQLETDPSGQRNEGARSAKVTPGVDVRNALNDVGW